MIEPMRLYKCFVGNLKESVPELSGSVLVTIFPQIICCIYFTFLQEMTGLGITVPIERAISFPYIVLLAAESVIGFMTVRKVVKSQAALFMLKLQDCDDEEFEENAVSYLKYIPPTGDPQSTTTAWGEDTETRNNDLATAAE